MTDHPMPLTATPELTTVGNRYWCHGCSRYRPKSQMHEQVSQYEWQQLLECKDCQQSKGHAHRTAVNVLNRMRSESQR